MVGTQQTQGYFMLTENMLLKAQAPTCHALNLFEDAGRQSHRIVREVRPGNSMRNSMLMRMSTRGSNILG